MIRCGLLSLVVIVVLGAKLPELKYTDCGSAATINSLTLDPPCTEDPCVFETLHTYTMYLNFTARSMIPRVYSYLTGYIGQQQTPFLVHKDACADKSVHCPVPDGLAEVYSANYTFPQQTNVPFCSLLVCFILIVFYKFCTTV